MNQLFTLLMGQLKADKGRDINRTAVLAGVIFLCWKTEIIDNRLTVVEAAHAPRVPHLATLTGAASPTNFASVGPE